MAREVRNLGASVRARLLRVSKERGQSFEFDASRRIRTRNTEVIRKSVKIGFRALTIGLQPLGELSGGQGALTGPPAPNCIHEHQKLVKLAILHRGFWSRPENWQEGFAANRAFRMRPHWDNVLGFDQLFGQWRCAVTGRYPACEFSPLRNTEILQAMNQELLQVSCLGRYSTVAPKGQLRGQSTFYRRVHLGGTHS